MSTQLQDASEARKSKLAALRARKRAHEEDGGASAESAEQKEQQHEKEGGDGDEQPVTKRKKEFKFRNYDPTTGQAKKHSFGKATAGGDEVQVEEVEEQEEEDTVERHVAGLAERVIAADAELRAQELDLTNIQPKKANWDLKAHLDKKLTRLRPKTDAAIATLIRRRLQGDKNGRAGEAAAIVAAAPRTVGDEPVSDDDDDDDE